MVHNGIEYGDMQLIAETYNIMKHALGLNAPEMADIFERWNGGRLNSYLIEITAKVLAFQDVETGEALVDLILDEAEQKGTGRWTSSNAIELGIPIPTIDAAVWSRGISAMKGARVAASKILRGPGGKSLEDASTGLKAELLDALEAALYCSKVSSYAQGMMLLKAASDAYGFELTLSEMARIWKGGCIIRAELLDTIQGAFERDPQLNNLLLDPGFAETLNAANLQWRYAARVARDLGVPIPAMSASLDYFDSYRSAQLPANLIQGLRDFFGAHTYHRTDKEGIFHTIWEPEVAPEMAAESVPATNAGATGEDESTVERVSKES
jgi:6-phosphogluconate dehydrogenase